MGNYYVNLLTGTIQQQNNSLLAKALMAAGFTGPYATIAQAKAAYNAAKGIAPAVGSGGLGAATAGPQISSALSSLNPLAGLFQANIWLRVGEFLIGVVLVGVGLAKLTGAENFVSNIVRKVPIG